MTEDYDASDRADVKDAERQARAVQQQDLDVVRDIMRNTSGRAWMYRKLAVCHVHSTTFNGNALQSAFAEGERNIGLLLEAEILQACPDQFLLMLREANERHITSDTARRNRKQQRNADSNGHDTSNFVNYAAEPGDGQVEREQ